MFFADRLTLDKLRRNDEGYMAIRARAARTGIYQYLGREVDPDGKHFAADQIVNVYRPADEVFDKTSLGSFIGKPITDNHPADAVTADNWRDLARGTIMGAVREVASDGEYVGFDLAFMDAALITAIDEGKRELSNGYSAELEISDGKTPSGDEYQAIQRNIRGNHVAVVDAGRAGENCRIGDAAPCAPIPSDEVKKLLVDQRTYDANRDGGNNRHNDDASQRGEPNVPKLLMIDGHQIDIANVDVAESTINKLIADAKAAAAGKTALETQVATLTTDLATANAKVATLETQLADAKVTPQMLRDAAASFALVAGKAKALGVDFGDDADEATIKRAVVDAKLGDTAKGWNDAQIDASFAALTKDAKAEDAAAKPAVDPLAGAIRGRAISTNDSRATVRDARSRFLAAKETAYLGQPSA